MLERGVVLRRRACRVVVAAAAIGATQVVMANAAWGGAPRAVSTAAAFTTSEAPGGASTAGQRVIALTFDDGPGSSTPAVLAVLEQYHVPATFFDIGDEVAADPQGARLVAAAGYPVENHTWSHPDLSTLSGPQVASQIDMAQSEISAVTGTTPACVRPPYDSWNSTVLSEVAARGLTTMSYSIDPKDWTTPGVATIVSRVVGAAFPRGGRRPARRRWRSFPDGCRPAADHHATACRRVLVRVHLRGAATGPVDLGDHCLR